MVGACGTCVCRGEVVAEIGTECGDGWGMGYGVGGLVEWRKCGVEV